MLIIGSGGREHALAWRLARDPGVERIVVAPGNPGLGAEAEVRPAADLGSPAGLATLAREVRAKLVVIGPEGPLVAGVADGLRASGLAVFGPGAAGARLEGSKSFGREVAAAAGVPIARGAAFAAVRPALDFAEELGGRVAVKADGLAGGKGVTVCDDLEEAEGALIDAIEGGRFGPAGFRVVVEERLEGREASLIALCDETGVLALPAARDHKRIGESDSGPNTGGMGAYSPVPELDDAAATALVERIQRPVLAELARRGVPFRGALYAGLMLTAAGPVLLEFNVRFGDPEAQAILPRVDGPLAAWLLAAAEGRLGEALAALGAPHEALSVDPRASVAVVLAAAGYPGMPRLGDRIEGLAAARDMGALVFTAGVRTADDGALTTAGGRVLAVVGRGGDVPGAAEVAYAAAEHVVFSGRQLRSDIGRALPLAAPGPVPTAASSGAFGQASGRPR